MTTNKYDNYLERFFYLILSMVIITLPLPKYSLNSQAIIFLFVIWLFYGANKEKWGNLRQMIVPALLMSSVFWLSLAGLLYTSNFDIAQEVIIQNIPFLIIPLVVFSVMKRREDIIHILKIFSMSVIVALFFGMAKVLYFKVNNLGDFFYYTEFSKIIEIHTTYFALYIVIAILYFLYNTFQETCTTSRNVLNILAILYLLVFLYIISSRISLVALVVMAALFFLFNRKISNKKKVLFFGISIMTFYLLMVSPNFQNRNSGISEMGTTTPDLSSRIIHWKAVFNVIMSNNLLIGNGTGDAHENLYEEYLNVGFEQGFISKYNAHNQFLENTLFFGILGCVSLVCIFGHLFFLSYKNKDFITGIIPLIFFIFMVTESILVRHSGIILFTLLMSLCFVRAKYYNNNSGNDVANT